MLGIFHDLFPCNCRGIIMASESPIGWCDLPKYELTFGLDERLIESYPALNVALRALSKILSNDHLLVNFSAHFIPFREYTGFFPVSFTRNIQQKMILCF